jgi:hypothetical protein
MNGKGLGPTRCYQAKVHRFETCPMSLSTPVNTLEHYTVAQPSSGASTAQLLSHCLEVGTVFSDFTSLAKQLFAAGS